MKRTSQRPDKPKLFSLAELVDPIVIVSAAGDAVESVEVRIRHRLIDKCSQFLDCDLALDLSPPLLHRFGVFPQTRRSEPLSTAVTEALVALQRPIWEPRARPPQPETVRRRPADILLARLTVTEYPTQWRQQARRSWYDVIDGTEGEAGGGLMLDLIMDIADASGDSDDDADLWALGEGSLFVYKKLEVHPELRGQHLGARLFAHALGTLTRSISDVAVAMACPEPSIWDPLEENGHRRADLPRAAFRDIDRLARYYERLGFARRPKVKYRRGGPTPLWLSYTKRLPFQIDEE